MGTTVDWEWLRDEIVWPEPGYEAPPFNGPGWVRQVEDYQELSDTLCEKFAVIFESITNTAQLCNVNPTDINPVNDFAYVQVIPQYVI